MSNFFGEKREGTPIHTLVAEWSNYCRRFTIRTRGHYKMVLDRFSASLPVKFIEDLGPLYIEKYISKLLEKSSNRTANAHLTAIKSFHKWLSSNYDVPNHAAGIAMLREDPPHRQHLKAEDYKNLLQCCNGDADAIKFLACSGLRSSEAAGLCWQDISDDNQWITVIGKGRKRRVIPTNQTIRDILKKHRGKPGTHINFLKNSRQSMYNLCRKITEETGIKISPQILRRFFANELLKHNVPLSHISSLLGHSSVRTTEVYLDHHPDLSGSTDVLDD